MTHPMLISMRNIRALEVTQNGTVRIPFNLHVVKNCRTFSERALGVEYRKYTS